MPCPLNRRQQVTTDRDARRKNVAAAFWRAVLDEPYHMRSIAIRRGTICILNPFRQAP
jgi:hypothetical protein